MAEPVPKVTDVTDLTTDAPVKLTESPESKLYADSSVPIGEKKVDAAPPAVPDGSTFTFKPQNGDAVESADTDLVRGDRSGLAQLAELGFPARPLAEIDSHPDPGLWELALMLPFGAMDRYHLLCSDGPASRVVLMAELMDGLEIEVKARMAEG